VNLKNDRQILAPGNLATTRGFSSDPEGQKRYENDTIPLLSLKSSPLGLPSKTLGTQSRLHDRDYSTAPSHQLREGPQRTTENWLWRMKEGIDGSSPCGLRCALRIPKGQCRGRQSVPLVGSSDAVGATRASSMVTVVS
jgi:hypothetical protein